MTPADDTLRANAQHSAYDFIKQEILALRLKPTEHLNANALAMRLAISRTPVREALGRLEQDGLVGRAVTGGFFVRPITLKEIVDVYRIREALEVEAALEALPNMNDAVLSELQGILASTEILLTPENYAEFILVNRKFHAAILRTSGNSMFSVVMGPVEDRIRLVGAMLIKLHAPRQAEVLAENIRILKALRSGDTERVEEAVRAHIRRAREHASKLLTRDHSHLYMNIRS